MKNLTYLIAVATLTFVGCYSTRTASSTSNTGTDSTGTVIQALGAGNATAPIVNRQVGGVSASGAVNGTSGNASGIQPAGTMGTANTTSGVASNTGEVNATAGDSSGAGTTERKGTAEEAQQFIKTAAVSGKAEVELSQLALKNAQSSAVKQFAAMMVKDHGGANAELKTLAVAKGLTITESSPAGIDGLRNSAPKDFDQDYIRLMTQDHIKAIHLFEDATKSSDPQVKSFAIKHLPTLKMHLKQVTAIGRTISKNAGN